MTKSGLEKRIDVWKEILRAILYVWILEISSTIARLVTKNFDIWIFWGILGSIGIGILYKMIWRRIIELIKMLEEIENSEV